jgi:hypothetical protein
MSRRNSATRRRAYGRRQHEVRERRTARPLDLAADWLDDFVGEPEEQAPEARSRFELGGRQQGRAAA